MKPFIRIDNDDLDAESFAFLTEIGLIETCWILDTRWCMGHFTYNEFMTRK